ncbi:MAG: TfoX/Sxy family protein [Polyangiaceae bacterium]|nr:TfoX/Sxy family protein [Polyangiaceae bacterium]
MPYSEELALRIRTALGDRDDVEEKQMFGGIAFMVAGSMACGVIDKDLLARVGSEQHEEALSRAHTRLMTFTGRPMKGFIIVDAAGIRTAASLKKWVDRTVAFVTSPEQRAKQKAALARKKKVAKKARAARAR